MSQWPWLSDRMDLKVKERDDTTTTNGYICVFPREPHPSLFRRCRDTYTPSPERFLLPTSSCSNINEKRTRYFNIMSV